MIITATDSNLFRFPKAHPSPWDTRSQTQ